MKVIYSIGGCTFNGGGIGTTSYHAVSGIYRHGMLKQLIVPAYEPSEIPEELITTVRSKLPGLRRLVGPNWANSLQDTLHAKLAARAMEGEAEIFHGWAGMSLEAVEKARNEKRGAGNGKRETRVVLDRASSHILEAKEIITEEYRRWGLQEPKYVDWAVQRELREYELAEYIFTPSEFARESFLKRGFSEEKIRLVRFGTASPNQTSDVRPKTSDVKKTATFNALFVGQVGFRKGILYALQAWQAADINKGKFYVVGPVTDEIKPFLAKYEDDPTIEFIGYADSSKYYPKADVFLFPSLEEGSALVTYEALSYGLPLITTFNSGSIVAHNKEGFIVSARNHAEIKEKLELLAEDRRKLQEMSTKARETIKNYTWESYGDNIVSEYEKIIRENG